MFIFSKCCFKFDVGSVSAGLTLTMYLLTQHDALILSKKKNFVRLLRLFSWCQVSLPLPILIHGKTKIVCFFSDAGGARR